MNTAMKKRDLILVTGATGYIGGQLVPRLVEAGYRLRCLARDPARLQGRSWLERVDRAANPQYKSIEKSPEMLTFHEVWHTIRT